MSLVWESGSILEPAVFENSNASIPSSQRVLNATSTVAVNTLLSIEDGGEASRGAANWTLSNATRLQSVRFLVFSRLCEPCVSQETNADPRLKRPAPHKLTRQKKTNVDAWS